MTSATTLVSRLPMDPLKRARAARLIWILAAAAIAAGYGYLLLWFAEADVYHQHFFDHGQLVRHYERARVAFIPYLVWQVYAVGACAIALFAGRVTWRSMPGWERFPLAFMAGAGIWHVLMFGVGLAGFDIKPVAVGLTLGVMGISLPHLAACLREVSRAARVMVERSPKLRVRWSLPRGVRGSAESMPVPSARLTLMVSIDPPSFLALLLGLGIVASAIGLVLIKGLYPAGGHDYYLHYFAFYNRVVDSGSILPNDVWYHFYYSKGAGLYFLAMLLSDPLAPQLVTIGFVAAAACMVFAFLKHAAPGSVLPWIGVLLFILLQIYTPGPGQNQAEGGWDDLEKIHELTAGLLMGCVWIAYRLFADDSAEPRPWTLALHLAIVAIGLLTTPLLLLVGAYLAGFVIWFTVRRQWRRALRPFSAGLTAATTLLVIGAINYHYTGLPLDQGILFFWRYADLKKIVDWGVLFQVLQYHQGTTALALSAAPWSWSMMLSLIGFLRLEIWWPLAKAALLVIALRLPTARRAMGQAVAIAPCAALCWFAIVVILVALFGGGRSQPISFYRMSSFSYGPTLCLVLLLWLPALAIGARMRRWPVSIMAAAALGFVAWITIPNFLSPQLRSNVRIIGDNAGKLWNGRFSLKDAYQNQQGWPGRARWGGIYPAMETVWRIVGPHQRIWSFHIHDYCMLPGCDRGSGISFRLSRDEATVYFDTPERAVETLKADGLNYFFFSKELGVGDDLLALSPLFAPENIANYIGVRWSDGTSYLLTWVGPDTTPLDPKILEELWSHQSDPTTWRSISAAIARHGTNLRPFAPPWCTTCEGLKPLD